MSRVSERKRERERSKKSKLFGEKMHFVILAVILPVRLCKWNWNGCEVASTSTYANIFSHAAYHRQHTKHTHTQPVKHFNCHAEMCNLKRNKNEKHKEQSNRNIKRARYREEVCCEEMEGAKSSSNSINEMTREVGKKKKNMRKMNSEAYAAMCYFCHTFFLK